MDYSVRLIPTQATLVEFDEPSFVRNMKDNQQSADAEVFEKHVEKEIKGMMTLKQHRTSCPDRKSAQHSELQDVLNTLIHPIQWIEDNKMWRQTACDEDVTREDVSNLGEELDQKLKTRQANPRSVCAIRRQLYSQFFDELIRQVTIICPERGLLLTRVRDEIRMTIDAHESIYETCKCFQSKIFMVPIPQYKTQAEEEQNEEEDKSYEEEEATGDDEIEEEFENEEGEEEKYDAKEVEKEEEKYEEELMSEMQKQTFQLELRVLEINAEKDVLNVKLRDLQDGFELLQLKYKGLRDADESWYNHEKDHLLKVKNQLERQLELFKGPNPHAEATDESILELFLKSGGRGGAAVGGS